MTTTPTHTTDNTIEILQESGLLFLGTNGDMEIAEAQAIQGAL